MELILQIPSGLPAPTELHAFHLMCERFRTMPKATIAVVEGRVGGGGSELALSCDMRFAAIGRATFNQPEVALGILPGGRGPSGWRASSVARGPWRWCSAATTSTPSWPSAGAG